MMTGKKWVGYKEQNIFQNGLSLTQSSYKGLGHKIICR